MGILQRHRYRFGNSKYAVHVKGKGIVIRALSCCDKQEHKADPYHKGRRQSMIGRALAISWR